MHFKKINFSCAEIIFSNTLIGNDIDKFKSFNVSRNVFVPVPNVDSAVVNLKLKKDRFEYEKTMFKLIKNGFENRRKTILNSFCKSGIEKEKIIKVLEKLDIDTRIRAEKLSLKDFKNIAREYENL